MTDLEKRLLTEYFGGDAGKLREAEARLSAHEPIAYIVGETVFYNETYRVSPDVLIPRPDTERVVDHILKHLPAGGRLLDLCCGSGCIAISSLCHSRNTTALLVDKSEKALEIARENAERNGVSDRCSFLCADLFAPPDLPGVFDVIASNPPYVRTDIVPTLEEECHREPYIAFDGGRDGGDFYRLFMRFCPPLLKKGGKMIFEIGYDQKELIESIAQNVGFCVKVYKDYGGNDRVALLTLPENEK